VLPQLGRGGRAQLRRVVGGVILEHIGDGSDVFDPPVWRTLHDQQVGRLAGRDRADTIADAQELGRAFSSTKLVAGSLRNASRPGPAIWALAGAPAASATHAMAARNMIPSLLAGAG
jgi:hypothetical protein